MLYEALVPVLILVIVAWGGSVFRIKQYKWFKLVDFFVLSLGTFNGIGYLFVLWATENGMNTPVWGSWIQKLRGIEWLFPTLSLISVLSVWAGDAAGNALWSRNKIRKQLYLQQGQELTLPNWVPWAFLITGVITYWLYAHAYGGFARLLVYSKFIRTGRFDLIGIENPLSFLMPFGGFGLFALLLFTIQLLKTQSLRARIVSLCGFITTGIFSVYFLITWLGRALILTTFATIILGVWLYRSRFNIRAVTFNLILLFAIIMTSMPIITSLLTPGKKASYIVTQYATDFSYFVAGFSAVVNTKETRGMRDMVWWPLYFLPSRLRMQLGIDTASTQITRIVMGAPKGERGVMGEVPADFVTFGLLEGGILGIVIWSFLWGVMMNRLEQWLLGLRLPGFQEMLYSYAAIRIAAMAPLGSEPEIIIKSNLAYIIGCVMITLLRSQRSKYKFRHKLRINSKE